MANVIPVSVLKRKVVVEPGYVRPTAGNYGTDRVRISLDSEWDGATLFVTFSGDGFNPVTEEWDGEEDITIPDTAIAQDGYVSITVKGVTDDSRTITARHVQYDGIVVAAAGETVGTAPTAAEEDLLYRVSELARDLEYKRDTGYFKGEPGQDADVARAASATSAANTAAASANAAATNANNVATGLSSSIAAANAAATSATNAASSANTAASTCNVFASYAEDEGDYAKEQGDYAKSCGNYATNSGNSASTAAGSATSAAESAFAASSSASSAATSATSAATTAIKSAKIADSCASSAKTNGTYAKEQGEYAEAQGDYAYEAGQSASSAATAASRVNATISGTTLTVTDRNGTSTSVDTKGATGAAGRDGRDGVDGYSPQAVVEQTATGATIYITDADGTTTASISNGTTPTIDPHEITLQGMTQGAAWTQSEQSAARGRIGIAGKHELLESITLTENATTVIRQATPSGKNYDLRNIHAVITTPANSGATAGNLYGYCNNILCFYNNIAAIQPDQSRIAIIDIDFNGGFMFGGCLVGTKNSMTTAPKGNTYIASGTTLSEKDSICKLSICSTTTIPAGTTIDIYGVWA